MKDQIRTTLGFLSGVAIGVSLGILFAPQKGMRTRALITEQAKLLKDRAIRGPNLGTSPNLSEEDLHFAV